MKSFILRSLGRAKRAIPSTKGNAPSAVARRDLFAGALGISAMAAAIAVAKVDERAAPDATASQATSADDHAGHRAALLGVVRGTLAHTTRENG
jgi:hypothetical protein